MMGVGLLVFFAVAHIPDAAVGRREAVRVSTSHIVEKLDTAHATPNDPRELPPTQKRNSAPGPGRGPGRGPGIGPGQTARPPPPTLTHGAACDDAGAQYTHELEPLALDSMTFETNRSCLVAGSTPPPSVGCIPSDRWHWARGKGVLERANKDRTYCGAMCGVAVCCKGKTFTAKALKVIRPGIPAPAGLEGETEITLVTAGTAGRLEAVHHTIARWTGPMVIVLHINAADKPADADLEVNAVAAEFKDLRENIRVVCYINVPTTQQAKESMAAMQALVDNNPNYTAAQRKAVGNVTELSTRYPINAMRNVAVDQAATNWVLVLDMDMVPSEGLYEAMKANHLRQAAKLYLPVLVVPHFEVNVCSGQPAAVPKDIGELAEALRTSILRPFHCRTDRAPHFVESLNGGLRSWGKGPHKGFSCTDAKTHVTKATGEYRGQNVAGIRNTEYDVWVYQSMLNYSGMYGIQNTRGFNYRHYEPFVAVRRVEANGRMTPRFSEYFVGRNLNKVSWVAQLYKRAFHFVVVLRDFVVHYPHKKDWHAILTGGSDNEGHARASQGYLDKEDAEQREREGWAKLHYARHGGWGEGLTALMSASRYMCPLPDQRLPPDFVRAEPPCPAGWPYLDRTHVFLKEHGDVCRDKPGHSDYWECPVGCKKSPEPPYCFPLPGNSNFAATIDGVEGDLRPCRIPF